MSWLYALRLGRWGVAGFGALAFAVTLLNAIAFYQVAGHTPAEREAFGRSIAELAAQFTVLLAPPVRADTIGGYVQFRAYGGLVIAFAVWALASASSAVRGDEERGLVESVLATGVSRADALAARFVAFAAGSLAAAAAAGLGLEVGIDHAHDSVGVANLLGATVLLAVLALCCYALTLLVCQLITARFATAASGIVLLALFLTNSLGRNIAWFRQWQWISPFHYYELSQPLPPGGSVDVRATEVLFGIAVIAVVVAALAFGLRDLGAPLLRPPARSRPPTRETSMFPAWRIPVVRALYDRRLGIAVWMAGVAALAVVFVILTKEIVKPLLALQGLNPLLSSIIKGDVYPSFLGFIWFGFAQLLVAAYAITQVGRWSAEDADGRLELTLSNPMSRGSVIAERAVVLVLGALLIAAAGAVAVTVESRWEAIDVSLSRLAAASALLVPFAACFGAIGSLIAARIPRATVGLLGGLTFATFFLTQLGPIFKWPEWALDLSPFHLYGQPMTNGVDAVGLTIMLLVGMLGFVGSAFLLQRRDVGA